MKEFVEKLFYFQNQLQLKHWQEQSGHKHEVLGRYYADLTELFDLLAECYMSNERSITATETAFVLINHIDMVGTYQVELSRFVSEMRTVFADVPALINILDDISTLIAKYNYLLSRE